MWKYENEYIRYLVSHRHLIDLSWLDKYLLNQIDFQLLIESINVVEVMSYKNFVKSQSIDDLLNT